MSHAAPFDPFNDVQFANSLARLRNDMDADKMSDMFSDDYNDDDDDLDIVVDTPLEDPFGPVPVFDPNPTPPAAPVRPEYETLMLPSGVRLEFTSDDVSVPVHDEMGFGAAINFQYNKYDGCIEEVNFWWAADANSASRLLDNQQLDFVKWMLIDTRRSLPMMETATLADKRKVERTVAQFQGVIDQHEAARSWMLFEQVRREGEIVQNTDGWGAEDAAKATTKEEEPLKDLMSLLTIRDDQAANQKIEELFDSLKI
ncbi:uncharacterized protein AB675_991 [Cyphellophora attinorum]|uniref:Uncharacterized protein n=1 Tax=Cyphellophora attinorum TaxID=1664694 RepID=A0A0N1H1R2_9EURO|nr:uncharacterized protein AB675_991 [Phialophora attinorum]KPI38142.1 hypothetical protein AB675_991 [Phialophora attinorum]